MADTKISALASGAPALTSDLIVVARVGSNAKLSLADVFALLYPVGSIYANASDSTDPATLFGFGTWASIGAGKVPVVYDATDTNFNTAGKTGGAKTSTSTGNISALTFTGTGSQVTSSVSAGTPTGNVSASSLTMDSYTPTGNVSKPTFTGDTVNTTAVSAGTPAGTVSTPTFTGDTVNTTGVSAGTPAGTNTIPVFSGSALGNHTHELPIIIASNTVIRVLNNAVFGTGTSRTSAANYNSTAGNTAGNVAITQGVSAGTPAGTINAPVFSGSALAVHNHNVALTGNRRSAAGLLERTTTTLPSRET